MTREPQTPADALLQDFLDFEAPEGYRVELINGEIIVTPPPEGDHEDIIGLIIGQVVRSSRTEMIVSGNKGLILGTKETGGDCRVIPDLTLAPAERKLFRGAPSWMDPAGVAMVVEVTSGRPELDRRDKRISYARAGVPLYLLVDREKQRITLFSGPFEGDYGRNVTIALGGYLELPKPFGFPLATAAFAASEAEEQDAGDAQPGVNEPGPGRAG